MRFQFFVPSCVFSQTFFNWKVRRSHISELTFLSLEGAEYVCSEDSPNG